MPFSLQYHFLYLYWADAEMEKVAEAELYKA